jgi:hypothetical protein
MLSWFLNAVASSAHVGASRLQWPHQGAKYCAARRSGSARRGGGAVRLLPCVALCAGRTQPVAPERACPAARARWQAHAPGACSALSETPPHLDKVDLAVVDLRGGVARSVGLDTVARSGHLPWRLPAACSSPRHHSCPRPTSVPTHPPLPRRRCWRAPPRQRGQAGRGASLLMKLVWRPASERKGAGAIETEPCPQRGGVCLRRCSSTRRVLAPPCRPACALACQPGLAPWPRGVATAKQQLRPAMQVAGIARSGPAGPGPLRAAVRGPGSGSRAAQGIGASGWNVLREEGLQPRAGHPAKRWRRSILAVQG